MKYVMFDRGGIEFPIVFPDAEQHSDIVRAIHSVYPGYKPVSAGFCSVYESAEGEIRVSAWGQSVTLNLKAKPTDIWPLEQLFKKD